jgi:hypothetical protein
MGDAVTSYVLSQLGYQAPALLVYLVAFALALVFMGRALVPSILCLVGVGVLVLTTIAMTVVQAYLLQSRQDDGRGAAEITRLMGIVGFVGGGVRAIGLSLLIAAIFVGRGRSKR